MRKVLTTMVSLALIAAPASAMAKDGKHHRSFGGNVRGEAAVSCVESDCATASSGVARGSSGKGSYEASVTFSTLEPTVNDDGFNCYSVTGGSVSIDAPKVHLTGTVNPEGSLVCDSTEEGEDARYTYRLSVTIDAGGTAKGETATGGDARLKGKWRADGDAFADKGSFNGKITF